MGDMHYLILDAGITKIHCIYFFIFRQLLQIYELIYVESPAVWYDDKNGKSNSNIGRN